MPDALTPLGWGIVVASALAAGGYFWDEKVTPEIRDNVYKTLKKILSKDVATLFVAAFDRIFDPHARGRPLFWRSVCASCVAITAVALVWMSRLSQDTTGPVAYAAEQAPHMFWSSVIVYGLWTNIVGDYFSLWETRHIVGLMATTGPRKRMLLVLLDIAATTLIYCTSLVAGLFVGVLLGALEPLVRGQGVMTFIGFQGPYWDGVWGLFGTRIWAALEAVAVGGGISLCDNNPGAFHGIFFYTTFLTSIWVWVFMLGIKLWPLFAWLEGTLLNVKKHPVGVAVTIGGVAIGAAITPVGVVMSLFRLGGC